MGEGGGAVRNLPRNIVPAADASEVVPQEGAVEMTWNQTIRAVSRRRRYPTEPIAAQMPTHGPRIGLTITMTPWPRSSFAARVRPGWQPRQP
jgi:hypothetical protein